MHIEITTSTKLYPRTYIAAYEARVGELFPGATVDLTLSADFDDEYGPRVCVSGCDPRDTARVRDRVKAAETFAKVSCQLRHGNASDGAR